MIETKTMIKRLYVHNFRCFENFDLTIGGLPSILLLGKNGAGKTTVGAALEVLQKIARNVNRVDDLVKPKDISNGRTDAPTRFEIEVILNGQNFTYTIAFEFPHGFRELRVAEEKLSVDGKPIFTRELAEVRLNRRGTVGEAIFGIDWHVVALPIVQESNSDDPLSTFKTWLRNILILRPVPSLVRGESEQNALGRCLPDKQATEMGAWFSGLVTESPATYTQVSQYLRQVMPDFKEIKNTAFGKDTRNLSFHFGVDGQGIELALEDLSDGEKTFFIYALVIASNVAIGPIFCFWDEPDNFLTPDEVGHSVMALRKAFQNVGQLIVTSHNPEAIRRFSESNTLFLSRKSHMEPTTVTTIERLRESGQFDGEFVDALIRGDID